MTARQCRLQEWTEQIKSCKNRPQGTSVEEWCSLQGITKANYYYRLRRVRMACLQEISKNNSDSVQVMAQVPEHHDRIHSVMVKLFYNICGLENLIAS